jgi:hypothetical protein
MSTLQFNPKNIFATLMLLILGLIISARAWAQEKDVNININTNNHAVAWYNIWWVWVIAGAVFVIILVAIVSAGKKT